MQVPFSALGEQHERLLPELMPAIESVLKSGHFVLGQPVQAFEKNFSEYHNQSHAIGVGSGTDALILALKALGIGPNDEVITTPNTFITTVSSIALLGAKPVLVDIGEDDNLDVDQIESHITERTRAILPVHWTGRPCDMSRIGEIAKRHGLRVIEDCAQAISARFNQQLVGTFGDVSCFSLHPFKTLNACGDAGVILTRDQALADKIRALRQNGLTAGGVCQYWSGNSRLDSMQAAILNVKFRYLEEWTKRRIEIANHYRQCLANVDQIVLPLPNDEERCSVFHTYIIKAHERDALRAYLQEHGIEVRVHYEVPVHRQAIAMRDLGYREGDLPRADAISQQVLSLPIYPELQAAQQDYIIEKIKSFYKERSAGRVSSVMEACEKDFLI